MATSVPDDPGSPPEGALPRCFGLIGGLGPPATVHYYHALIAAHAARGASPRLLIAHAGMGHALGFVAAGDRAGLAGYPASLIRQLAEAGAEFGAIPAVTPPMCMLEPLALSPIGSVSV